MNILPSRNFGGEFGDSLASGLQQLAQHKINENLQKKGLMDSARIFEQNGYDPNTSQLLAHLQKSSPQNFHQVLGQLGSPQQQQQNNGQMQFDQQGQPIQMQEQQPQQNFAQKFSQGQGSTVLNKAQEAAKIKLEPTAAYFDDLEETVDEMLSLVKGGNVKFGLGSAALKQIPFDLGKQLLNSDTGTYDALSDKFALDADQGTKGVGSAFRLKIRQGSKPGLTRTKDQNIKLLEMEKQRIDRKRQEFYRLHPFMKPEGQIDQQQPNSSLPNPQSVPVGQKARNKKTGAIMINTESGWKEAQ